MTQEEKELLFKDLCARLPYKVKVQYKSPSYNVYHLTACDLDGTYADISAYKPYLRPMSSMTNEEMAEIQDLSVGNFDYADDNHISIWEVYGGGGIIKYEEMALVLDWLNAHHFDYRGLIEKGLAIEVTESNNPYKSMT